MLVTTTTPPVTMPVEPMEAIAELLLLHVPPPVPSNKLVVRPEHTVFVPVIGEGNELTVTTTLAAQAPIVYDIVAVPFVTPVTTPVTDTEPVPGLTLLHTPLPVASLRLVVRPWHTDKLPDIAAG